ncbi:MAG: DEAD/DEAH box helicase [Desulfohalobiaceae bacterium]|nr:DEAD/DEAH box helicase [Desulfohalobiaceae bacterium]
MSKGKQELQARLQEALEECAKLRAENERLRALLGFSPQSKNIVDDKGDYSPFAPNQESTLPTSNTVNSLSSAQEKIALFRSLFRGRDDVFPKRWQNQKGRSGYSPACAHEWKRSLCAKPRVKCSQCENRQFLPVTDQVIYDHLAGKQTIGAYPLLPDETCWFLAADFDKKAWQEDAAVFLEVCREMGVPGTLERSRSGNGGHVWIFFQSPVAATTARKLGCAVLTMAMERRRKLGLDSYDRLFPNQDTLPSGGFGNLIALPLQYYPRSKGNSIFLDADFQPYQDQWAFLAELDRMSPEDVDELIQDAERQGKIIGVSRSINDDEALDPWTLPPSQKQPEERIRGQLPSNVQIVQGNMIYVQKNSFPDALLNRLTRLASFQNPEFYKAQALRLSTFGKPRIISCVEEFSKYLGLPRGCLNEVVEMLENQGVCVHVSDKRVAGKFLDVQFNGTLTSQQQQAAEKILHHDVGVLSAATAFGKTVVAAWLIAKRKTNTLILVHRRQLMDQWHERLSTFLGLPSESMGWIGGGKHQLSGQVDVATFQSVNRKGVVQDLVADYGQVIVDECHHVSAVRFEQVLRQVKAKYVCGLTATPTRKDGHHPIIYMQCGPVRFRVDSKKQTAVRPFEHIVVPRYTSFVMPPSMEAPSIQEIYATLAEDEDRNELIINDLLEALERKCSPVLLAERTSHVEYFESRLRNFARNVVVLRGGMGKKQRQAVAERLAAIPDTEERVLIATGRYIGEGFDDSRLDTLFLVSPVSWKGTLQQYAGRLHRLHHNKRKAVIYDYVDHRIPQLARMFDRRLAGYRAMGYKVQESERL